MRLLNIRICFKILLLLKVINTSESLVNNDYIIIVNLLHASKKQGIHKFRPNSALL